VQDLVTGDGAVDGLALAYADEQKITGTDGNVKALVVQMQVSGRALVSSRVPSVGGIACMHAPDAPPRRRGL
jgi:hypothetical protein